MFKLGRILVFVLAFSLYPDASVSETLEEAITRSLDKNPRLLALNFELKSLEQGLKASNSALLPTVELSTDADAIREIGNGSSTTSNSEYGLRLGLILKKNLYDGQLQKNKIAEKQAELLASISNTDAVRETIALELTQKYLDVLRASEIYGMIKTLHKEAVEIHKQAKVRLDSGISSVVEYDRISLSLARTEANHHAALNNYLVSKAEYKAFTGNTPNPIPPSTIPKNMLPESHERALQIALQQHPTRLACKYSIEKARAQYEASLAIGRPRVDLSLNANIGTNENLYGNAGYGNRNGELAVKITSTWVLFNGNRSKYLSASDQFQLQKAQSICDQNLREIEISLDLSWSAFETLLQKTSALRQQIQSAESLRSILQKRYAANLASLDELFHAEKSVFDAKRDLVIHTYDLESSKFRILNATGQLLTYFGLKNPK